MFNPTFYPLYENSGITLIGDQVKLKSLLALERSPSQTTPYTFYFPSNPGSDNQALFWSGTETTFRGIAIADVATLEASLASINTTLSSLGSAAFKDTGTTNGTVPLIGAGDKLSSSLIPGISSTTSDSFTINSDAANTGSDRSLTLSRSPTQSTSYSLIFPKNLGTAGQALILGGSGELEWGAGSQSASIANSAPAPNQILYKDANWGLVNWNGWIWRSRESGGEAATGKIEVGYFLLRTKMYIPLSGGGDTNGNLKIIKIVEDSSSQVLFQIPLANTLIGNTDSIKCAVIDTSTHAGKICKVIFEDNDPNSGWAWIGVDPRGIFIEGNPAPPTVNESLCLNTILFKNTNWGLVNVNNSLYWRSRESGGESATGRIDIGYIKLLNNLHIALAGGGNTNGGLKVVKIFSAIGTLLSSHTLSQMLIGNTNDIVYSTINTSTFANTIAYLSIEDNDTGSSWSWVGIDPTKVFVSN